jgi:predicted adenylyl cyclase CyaB
MAGLAERTGGVGRSVGVVSTEIELKVRVADRPALINRLEELEAEPLGEAVTSDVFLDTEDHKLRAADCGLRIRSERARSAKASDKLSGASRTALTYKGPRASGPVKRREEIELGLDSLDAAVALFERLGYRQNLRFEKQRRSWRLGGCRVELDRVPHLGDFVEIEGPDVEAIEAVRRDLRLQEAEPVRESYAALLDQHLRENGIAERIVRLDPAEPQEKPDTPDHPPSG